MPYKYAHLKPGTKVISDDNIPEHDQVIGHLGFRNYGDSPVILREDGKGALEVDGIIPIFAAAKPYYEPKHMRASNA
jgi:hypothetical protein